MSREIPQGAANIPPEEIVASEPGASGLSGPTLSLKSLMPGLLAKLRLWSLPLLILAGLVGTWELWVQLREVPRWQLPAPSEVARELVSSRALLWDNALVTMREIVLGFMAALAAGLLLAAGIA